MRVNVGFSHEWDLCYADGDQLSIWPWSDLVSLVNRHCKAILSKQNGRALELGCGAGANIPLFQSLKMDYHAIEGSTTIVKQLGIKYPEFSDSIVCGDFTSFQPFGELFDLIFDRAAITHNNESSIRDTLEIILRSLKTDGIFIGSDWFSTKHSDYESGEEVDDKYTKTKYTKGQFVGIGKVHFSDEQHIRDLFCKFDILYLEEKTNVILEPKGTANVSSWNIVAVPSKV